MIRFLLILIIGYVIMKYVVRPLLMAFVVKSAGKMMEDMQNRQQAGTANQGNPSQTPPPKKDNKEGLGEYIDYEEVK